MSATDDRVIVWQGKNYTLTPYKDHGWRLRSRARGDEFDWKFPRESLRGARQAAVQKFEERTGATRPKRGTPTLEDVVTAYLAMPKRAGVATSYNNTTRLRAVVRLALGKELDRVFVSELGPKLWASYMAKRLPGGVLDLATRRPGNAAINSAVRCASSLFIGKLRHHYEEAGIAIPENAAMVQWLPEMKQPKPQANGAALLAVWEALPKGSPMRRAVGLARWAGLRREEAKGCQRHWIIQEGTGVYVVLMDRPEEGFMTKTGEIYRALVIHEGFAAELLEAGPGHIVPMPEGIRSRDEWFERKPQEWLKPFTGSAKKPLHRLRSMYADEVKRLTEDAVAARLAGVQAAADALGHTSTKTTENHYLSD